jgi:hypothetical protein
MEGKDDISARNTKVLQKGGERGDEADVRTFRRFNRANAAVVRLLASLAILLLLFSTLTGCVFYPRFGSASKDFPALQAGQGRIFFYRDHRFPNSVSIYLNGKPIGYSLPGVFFYLDEPGGKYYTVVCPDGEGGDNDVQFWLTSGETKYIRTEPDRSSSWAISPAIEDEVTAMKTLSTCKYFPQGK